MPVRNVNYLFCKTKLDLDSMYTDHNGRVKMRGDLCVKMRSCCVSCINNQVTSDG